MIANKKTAFSLVSNNYDKVIKEYDLISKNLSTDEFFAYEFISKGYAILEVEKNKNLTENQKKRLFKLIKSI
jgi:hypothetical protein